MAAVTEQEDRNETFSLMKQWLFAKLHVSQTNLSQSCSIGAERDRDLQSPGLPKIVISRGSDKSINKLSSPSPCLKRPRPLVKSWINYNESSREAPASAQHNHSFWNSPKVKRGRKPQWSSLPCSPIEQSSDVMFKETHNNPYRLNSNGPKLTKMCLPTYDLLNQSPATPCSARSVLDSPSMCGHCGCRKFSGSRELVGFEDINRTPYDESCINSAVNSPRLKQRHLGLRRTSSCQVSRDLEKRGYEKTERMTKASSNIDFQKRSLTKGKKTKSSRSSARSTISLTRSWSINLETFRIVKSDSLKTASRENCDRKMSLNDNELRRVSDRRRSSLLRLLCADNMDSDKEEPEDSLSLEGTESVSDIPEYSPKVTRGPKFVNGAPLDDFRSTFEPDTVPNSNKFGQLKIMFQFYNDRKQFIITLLKGANVVQNINGTLGIYAKMCLMPGKKQQQTGRDKHDTHDPVFYETFTFRMTLGELLDRELRIKLYNKPGIFSTSEPIAECYISLYHYDLTAVTVIWQNLHECRRRKVCIIIFTFPLP